MLSRALAWAGRLRTALRVLTYGTEDLHQEPHAPLAGAEVPGACICGLRLGHPLHGRAGQAQAAALAAGRRSR